MAYVLIGKLHTIVHRTRQRSFLLTKQAFSQLRINCMCKPMIFATCSLFSLQNSVQSWQRDGWISELNHYRAAECRHASTLQCINRRPLAIPGFHCLSQRRQLICSLLGNNFTQGAADRFLRGQCLNTLYDLTIPVWWQHLPTCL